MIYFNSLIDSSSGYIYSVDMIRINFELNESIIDLNDKFNKLLHNFSISQFCELKTYFSKAYGYRYLYSFTIDSPDEKCSFILGLQLGSKSENKNKGFIEFNPNKCYNSKIFKIYYDQFRSLCFSFKVKRYDLAIDLPYQRNFVKMIRYKNMNYSYEYYDNNGVNLNSSITEYLGRRNHNLFTKLYDKTAESKLDYDLTRIEFTFDRDFEKFDNLPEFMYLDQTSIINLSSSNLVLAQLLMTSEDFNYYYKMLTYRKKQSLKPYFDLYKVNFDLHKFLILRGYVLSFEF